MSQQGLWAAGCTSRGTRCPRFPWEDVLRLCESSHGPAGDPKPAARGQVGAVLGLIRTTPSTPAGCAAGRRLQLGPSRPAWGQMSGQCVILVLNLRPYAEGAWDPAWWGPKAFYGRLLGEDNRCRQQDPHVNTGHGSLEPSRSSPLLCTPQLTLFSELFSPVQAWRAARPRAQTAAAAGVAARLTNTAL